jgi:DNA primase
MDIDGNVERSDIIGAVFGQTEGLFGPTFDLREMAKTGKIGRIEVEIKSRDRRTTGIIKVPSSLDIVGTSLIAAMIETVDQVGPFRSTIKLKSIKDFREEKLKAIVSRAKKILESWKIEKIPAVEDVLKELENHMVPRQVKELNGITIGPQALSSNEIILVEGRADVINLVKYGIENVASIGGGKIPDRVKELLKNKKKIIAFLDGDRSGYLNLKKLANIVKRIDYVAFAPEGKEVEDLKPEEIFEALKNLKPFEEAAKIERPELKPYLNYVNEIVGTLEALLIKGEEIIKKVSVGELIDTLNDIDKGEIDTIIMDGIITQRLVDLAEQKGVNIIIGNRIRQLARVPENMILYPLKSGD